MKKITLLVTATLCSVCVLSQPNSSPESRYKDKLKIELTQKGEVMLYNKVRDVGLSHQQALDFINANADVGVKCQFVAFTKLPKSLVVNMLKLVDDGRSILEANRMAMSEFKKDFLSRGNSEDDYLKFLANSGNAWNQCMNESRLEPKNFIK